MEENNSNCCKCENEVSKNDRFIIVSMETAEMYCLKCFIKHELVILDVDEETKEQYKKEATPEVMEYIR